MPTFFKVSELSQQTGIHTETIRYYEKIGLLPPPKRSSNGYRCYTTDSVQQLLFIKTCRSLGFSLEEIKTLYHWQQNPVSHCQQVDDLVAEHLEQVDTKIQQLQEIRAMLAKMADCRHGKIADCKAIQELKALA